MANLSILYTLLKNLNGSDDKNNVINKIIAILLEEEVISKSDVDDAVKTFLDMTKDLEESMGNGKSYREAYLVVENKYSDFFKNISNLN